MTYQANQTVQYRGEEFTVLNQQSDNWVRITNRNNGEHGFVVHKALLTLVATTEQPKALKELSPSVEQARHIVRLAFDYKTLCFALRKSGYYQNDLRSWMAEQNRRGIHFGLLKSMTIAKVAKIIRVATAH